MKPIEAEFQSNANGMGVMVFRMVCRGRNAANKTVYIYSRRYPDQENPSLWEVFIPTIKKAGTYPLPNNKSITYTEDFEEYPGASKFGFSAWSCNSLPHAKMVYERLMAIGEVVEAPEEPEPLIVGAVAIADSLAPKHRGRQKGPRPALTVPIGEFSTNELAEQNKVDYPAAALFIREALDKTIRYVRCEQRNARGKKTNLYTAMQPA